MNGRKNLSIRLAACVLMLALAVAVPAGAVTHYVIPGQSIQAAIDDPCTVNGDEIEVAQGIYIGAINFNGKAITLRSTDPNDPSVVAATIIHGAMASSAVTCSSSEDANTILEGFTIMLGQAAAGGGMCNVNSSPTVTNCTFSNNYATDFGAGMANFGNSSPTVKNCTFSNNYATDFGGGMCNWVFSSPTVTNCTFSGNSAGQHGGGMYNNVSSPTVTDCNFSGNTAATDGGGMYNFTSSPTVTECSFIGNSAVKGGGMFNYASSPTVTDCTFSDNSATTDGGGMYVMGSSSPTVRNCTFTGNTATTDGGGMYNLVGNPILTNCRFNNNTANCGGGMCNRDASSPTVTNCTFTGNTASSGNRGGGGMYCYDSSPTVTNCTFYSNAADEDGGGIGFYGQYEDSPPNVTNCLFIENTAGDTGGGMCNSYGTPTVTNCTFIGNSAGRGGGGIRNYNGDPIVTNCILWGDTPDEIYDSGGSTVTSYSDVQGDDVWPGQGNINADPLFVNPARGDLRLVSYRSPCVDTGDNSVVTEPNDLAGNPRVVDGDQDTTATVDMGAYEFNGGPVRNLRLNGSYLSIQAAIDDADPCDKIEVAPGTYYESIDFDSKSIHLYSSDGPQVTTIDGDGAYHVVQCISGEGPNTILEGFTITGGNANGSGYNGFGGGMFNWTLSGPTVINCTFSGNSADFGGAMFNLGSSPTVANCTFTGNTSSEYGGGMYNSSSSPTVTNCTFTGNTCSEYGGGMYNSSSSPTVTNCTFTGNSADYGGGMRNNNSSPIVTNCILWNDTPDEIYDDATSTTTVRYSDVQAGWSGEGNIDQNPLLRNVAERDLSLAPWSPCIDTGNNAVVGPNATDITGLPRLVDGDCNTTVIVDMGAYEFRHAYGGDFDSSCLVNMADYAFLAWAWLASPLSENWDPVCDISVPADGSIDAGDVKVLTGNWLRSIDTPITCDANRLKDEFALDAVCAAAVLSAAPCAYSPNDVAQALYDVGYSAAGAHQALTQVCGMSDGFAIEQLLYNTGYPPDEYLESAALSFVRKFAPVLYFDSAYKGLPMSAQLYFNTMLYPVADSMTETMIWRSATHGPCVTANCGACGTVKVCGRDTCDCGMSNGNFQTLRDGEIPTYYKVISDIDSAEPTGPKGRLRIAYWWFYGFQQECNIIREGPDGAHHGDWEHIIVTTDPDRTIAESVTYYFHKSWYTRKWGGFETWEDRPVVYVGKIAHGSYHSDAHSGWGVGTPYHCCDYADYRDSDTPDTRWYNCWENIVSLGDSSEPWMRADRIGTLYEYDGNPYRIESWRWGPYLSYCNIWVLGCFDWERTYACATHPTIHALDWDICSCDGVGCGAAECAGADYVPPIDYDQGWPWEGKSMSSAAEQATPTKPATLTKGETVASCGSCGASRFAALVRLGEYWLATP